jgi:hypothetical protein
MQVHKIFSNLFMHVTRNSDVSFDFEPDPDQVYKIANPNQVFCQTTSLSVHFFV